MQDLSSLTSNRTWASVEAWSPNHWTSRECAKVYIFFNFQEKLDVNYEKILIKECSFFG